LQLSISRLVRALNKSLQRRLVFLVVGAGIAPAVLVALLAYAALALSLLNI